MTHSSVTASVSAPEFSRPSPVFRRPKRGAKSIFRGAETNLAHNFVPPRAEFLGKEALEDMFYTSRSKFVTIAYSILRNKEDAEDAVQNAFLLGYRHLRSCEGRSALRTWFTLIVLNAALMIQRKRKASMITPFPENSNLQEGDWLECIPASQPDPEVVHAERETLQFIDRILGK